MHANSYLKIILKDKEQYKNWPHMAGYDSYIGSMATISVIVSEDTKSYAHKHILWQVTKSLYKSISQKYFTKVTNQTQTADCLS